MSLLQNSNAITPVSGFELKSGRFEDGDSAYLSRTPAAASNRRTFTLSCWVKRSALGTAQAIFSAGTGSTDDGIQFTTSDTIRFYTDDGNGDYQTTAVYRDVGSWYHIVMAIDTTQALSLIHISEPTRPY